MRFIMFFLCISKVTNLLFRSEDSSPVKGRFTIKFLCWVVYLKVKRWYKYVFGYCVDGGMYFTGSRLAWVQGVTKF